MATHPAPLDAGPLFDDYAHDQVRIRARILVKEAGLPLEDQQDVRQDMYVELTKAQKRFDPSKAGPHTFVSRVLDRFCKHFVRQQGRKIRKGIPLQPCSDIGEGFDLDDLTVGDGILADMVRAEWIEDVREVISGLPEQLQRLCELLLSPRTKEQIAEELGMSRRTVYRRIGELRKAFLAAGIGRFPGCDDTESPEPQK